MSPLHTIQLLTRVTAVLLVAAPLVAQKAKRAPARPDSTREAAEPNDPALRALHWRLVGPFRGGRAVAVAGDPARPLVFYFGAVDGGVWKTTNGGETWSNVTDGRSDIASVGAIAVAPSDPNVIYVGAAEADWREDLTYGEGMWRSTDGGETWRQLALADTRHIAAVRVDPANADVIYVAAMGHAFGPNPMRGVFRSTDGGKTWSKVLFVDDSTGAIDLALDPTNPRVLYAAMWKSQRFPWGFAAGGGRSGLWKSRDGGDTWTDITASRGLPSRPLGRIGIAASPAHPSRLWASVEAPAADSSGGIFRSDDGGASWERVNAEQKFMVRPWYFSSVAADPTDENTVYVLNLGTWRSVDGGKSFSRIRVPHGDCHILWIDPKDPHRMIEGNDGGATVSFDGGSTWSTVYNQPTAQFYHVATDDQFPYRIYGAQQDNSTVSIASRSDDGAIALRDWQLRRIAGEGGRVVGRIGRRVDPPVARRRRDVGRRHTESPGPVHARESARAVAFRRRRRVRRGQPLSAGRRRPLPVQDLGLRQDVDENRHGHSRGRVHARDPRGSGPARPAVRRHRDRPLRDVGRRRTLAAAAAQPAAQLGARHRHPRERPDRRDPRAGVLGARRHLTTAPAEPLAARRAPAPACTRAGGSLPGRPQRATGPLGRGEPAPGCGHHLLAAAEAGRRGRARLPGQRRDGDPDVLGETRFDCERGQRDLRARRLGRPGTRRHQSFRLEPAGARRQ